MTTPPITVPITIDSIDRTIDSIDRTIAILNDTKTGLLLDTCPQEPKMAPFLIAP